MGKLLQRLRAGVGPRLFVHCATSIDYVAELSASSPWVGRYSERALLLAEPHDIVCVTHEVDASYLEFLADFGLGPKRENLVVASRFSSAGGPLWERLLQSDEALDLLSRRMQAEGTTQLHPFICTGGEFELARALGHRTGTPVSVLGGDPDLVAYADGKHHIRTLSLELGVPVAPGEVVDSASLLPAVSRQLFRTGRVIVRGAWGAAGSATFICGSSPHDQDRLRDWLSRRIENRIFLVETMVDVVASPNIQIHVSADGSTECVGITDQLLDLDLTHCGNALPSHARCIRDMVRSARLLGGRLGHMGYTGIAGFDFVEYINEDGDPRFILAELNPRVNGATYPLVLRERISPRSALVSGSIVAQVDSFDELRRRLSDLLYSPVTECGILPYTTGGLAYGTCGIIALASSRQEATELFAEAELRLTVADLPNEPVSFLAGIT